MLGGWPLSQLAEGVGDSSCLLLSGVVAVLDCCIVPARSLQGMACVRSGQAAAWPLVSDRSVRRDGVKHDFACTFTRHLVLCSLPCPMGAVTVMLEAGGADTYTSQAIPGSAPGQFSLHLPAWSAPVNAPGASAERRRS